MVVYQGIDYASVPAVLTMLHIIAPDDQAEIFHGLRVMEGAALKILNEKRSDG